jgi:hypothetical protein
MGNHPISRDGHQSRIYLLTGLLRCGFCGGSMRGSSGSNGKHYYRDATQIEHTGTCHQPLVRAEQIELQIVDYLKNALSSLNEDEILSQYQQKKDDIESRWKRAKTLFLAGEIDRNQYKDEKARRDKLENALLN